MSVVEVEKWRVASGSEQDHENAIRTWFDWVKQHRDELFKEWKSVRYYRELDTESREPSGTYIMLFEFYSIEARDTYKERRADWSGPYAEYREFDPYQFFDESTVAVNFWEPSEEDIWLDFD